MQGMETAYVGNGVFASEASTTVGTEVIKAVAEKYTSNNQIGKATIEIDGFGEIDNVTGDATVSVYTTDFVVEGTITLNNGVLTWGEIEPNVPRIANMPTHLELTTNQLPYTINATLKGSTGSTITWSNGDSTVVNVTNGQLSLATDITGSSVTANITASADGCESKKCIVTITVQPILISREDTSADYVGCYADLDGVEGIDGIIYADLLAQKPVSGQWGTDVTGGTYIMPPTSTNVTTKNVKDYVRSATRVIDSRFDSKPRYVIKPADSTTGTENRFYVMSLLDSDSKLKWSTEMTQGSGNWKVPSKEEWAMFGNAFNISSDSTNENYYEKYKLSASYWTSSEYDSINAWCISFTSNTSVACRKNKNDFFVRLCTDF